MTAKNKAIFRDVMSKSHFAKRVLRTLCMSASTASEMHDLSELPEEFLNAKCVMGRMDFAIAPPYGRSAF